ncbi:hypothetical protein [Planktothrix agardhii]|jgi:hypothetical protein|uniref:hypothetical protein n=1 Tax=Planktothrix agardhii TaxID=1160 RepID=UPI0028B26243|nr:hypothetical protein [Planktothrix agardhii]
MSVYLDKQTLGNAFCYLIDERKKYLGNGIDGFQQIKFDEIMDSVENKTDKFNAAELIYASDTIKATFLVNKEADITRKMLGQIARKSENRLTNSILLSFTHEILLTLAEICKINPNDPRCPKFQINSFNYIEIASILRDNDVPALIVDRQDGSFSLADRGDGSFGRAFGVNARRSFRVNARIAMSGDRDLEAEKEKIDIMWDSYKEYIIKFWEELEQNNL